MAEGNVLDLNGFADLVASDGVSGSSIRRPASSRATEARIDVPAADFGYVDDGKIKPFNYHFGVSIMLEQVGIWPDFAAVVKAQGAEIA